MPQPDEQHTEQQADTPQSIAIATPMDLAQHALDEEYRLEAARLLLNR